MDLATRCVKTFDRRDWQRGREYFQHGAVAIHDCTESNLEASVEGSQRSPYSVYLDWTYAAAGKLLADCSCPRFVEVGICKHVAATVFAADDDGISRLIPGNGPLFVTDAESPPVVLPLPGNRRMDAGDDEDDGFVDAAVRPTATAVRRQRNDRSPNERGRAQSTREGADWKRALALLRSEQASDFSDRSNGAAADARKRRQIWYLLDLARTMQRGSPAIALRQRPTKKDGTPGKLTICNLSTSDVSSLPSDEDRVLLGLLLGNDRHDRYSYEYGGYSAYQQFSGFVVAPAMFDVLLPRLCASGRFGWLPEPGQENAPVQVLEWDDGPPWKLRLDVAKTSDQKHWRISGVLERAGGFLAELSAPRTILAHGLVMFANRIARFDSGDTFRWVAMLRNNGPLLVPVRQTDELIEQLAQCSALPRADWPDVLRWQEESVIPRPTLHVSKPTAHYRKDLECRLGFLYGERTAPRMGGPPAWYDRTTKRLVRRDPAAEADARSQLLSAGARVQPYYDANHADQFVLAPNKLPRLVSQLTAAGWLVEAEGRLFRQPGSFRISITSGVDWFDLEAGCDFEGVTASPPQLLAALRNGDQYVQLDDGSQGLLPEDWLARYAPLAKLGRIDEGRLRFVPAQAALLDALLAAQEIEHVAFDKEYARRRDQLRKFDGIAPRNEPKSFVGELRHYQREGLGWLNFLDKFGFGGCLADDMGLGKTVQVLALLDARRKRRTIATASAPAGKRGSRASSTKSLVVAPRSLIFNWIEEARRFCPKLRVLDYTGLDRAAARDRFDEVDLIVTTYGTLRRDIVKLREVEFDYVILDEAQAIKNAASQAAKACRLLRAHRRLAMTGTPVENHVGELWSLFEFLNPGILGTNQNLNQLFASSRVEPRTGDQPAKPAVPTERLHLLGRALRPFMLRRTKQQVLTELPAKTEQTLYCELSDRERAQYEELREHYRRSLSERVNKVGINKSKIHVLEALLRLRQAACHPGLIDKKKIDRGSSKLETLLEQLTEIIDGGHKALVFSQFTSLLAIVRAELDRREVVYEYLDGRTVKRQAKVDRFQTDPKCRLFLISLKAGGQGLNLTAADYVFILDPWWNPAVEAQAVDRAHRIGQDRHVFAYRLIARDTVEEKILQLQDHKRDLADAIVSADNSLLRNLTAEDLQLLLG